jgi:hypothetical protein
VARAAGGLERIAQDDFAAGMIRASARHLISSRGLYDIENGLLDDDGAIYRRGGTEYVSDAAVGGEKATWVWQGHLPAVGQRTLFATPSDFAVLNGASPVNIGGSGLAAPVGSAVVGGILFIGGGTMYAGSRKAADYSAGTISYTDGSKIITGVGTAWLANADAGMLFRTTGGRYHVVASVDSDTQLTLLEPVFTSAAGVAYTLTRLGVVSSHSATGPPVADNYVAAGGRLWALEGRILSFSEGPNPGTTSPALIGRSQTNSFLPENYHELPAGAEGLGLAEVRGRVLVFTTSGVFSLTGAAFNIVDSAGNPQQRFELTYGDLVLVNAAGLVGYEGGFIAPCQSGVFLVDGISAPLRLDRSISNLWETYVAAERVCGRTAVYKNHLFLPVLDATTAIVDFLVCRLDRPVRTRLGDVFGWTRFADHAAVLSLAGDPENRRLLGASGDGRILDLADVFEPSAAGKIDADGTEHVLSWETRDFTAGDRNESLWRRVRLRYELVGDTGDDPVIYAYAGVGRVNEDLSLWGTMVWGTGTWSDSRLGEVIALAGAAPETDRTPYAFEVGLKGEFVRYRFESSGPIATLSVRAVESMVRRSGKVFA